ncbi:MAG TPA: hypothetical protein VEX68_22130 [Bryobacteraceae bacterium]|nr:hypothetical protein [Bryobacteraceae bacterium]
MTRRDLGITFAAAAALAHRPANPLSAAQAPASDLDAAAREQVQRTRETLRKFKVPIAIEPSVTFRP